MRSDSRALHNDVKTSTDARSFYLLASPKRTKAVRRTSRNKLYITRRYALVALESNEPELFTAAANESCRTKSAVTYAPGDM